MAIRVLYFDGTSWQNDDLANIQRLAEADRDRIEAIKVEANSIMVPDFSRPLGTPVPMKRGFEPVKITKGMFNNTHFKNLKNLDLGDGFVSQIEDGALANLPKLVSLRWNGALNLDENGKPKTKYSEKAFIDRSIPEAERTKLNVPCVVGVDEASSSAVAFEIGKILTKYCLNEPVDGLNVPMQTDDRGYIKPIIKERKESWFKQAIKGQHPITSALIGIGAGAIGIVGFTAITALTSGAGAAFILPALVAKNALIATGVGGAIGGVLASLPIIRRFTKVGKYETEKRKIEKAEERAKKRELKYLKNIEKMKAKKAEAKEAVVNHFAATGAIGTLKKVTGHYKRVEKRAEKKAMVYRDRALTQDQLMERQIRIAENSQSSIEAIESAAGETFAFGGTVEEIRKRQRAVRSAQSRYGTGSVQMKSEQDKLDAAVRGVLSKEEGEEILMQVQSTETSMKSQVEELRSHARKVREKVDKDARNSGVDMTR